MSRRGRRRAQEPENETNAMWRAWREDQKRHASRMALQDKKILDEAVASGKVLISIFPNGHMHLTNRETEETVNFWITRGTVVKNQHRFQQKGARVALKAIGIIL